MNSDKSHVRRKNDAARTKSKKRGSKKGRRKERSETVLTKTRSTLCSCYSIPESEFYSSLSRGGFPSSLFHFYATGAFRLVPSHAFWISIYRARRHQPGFQKQTYRIRAAAAHSFVSILLYYSPLHLSFSLNALLLFSSLPPLSLPDLPWTCVLAFTW